MRGEIYQITLIAAGIFTTVLLGAFFYREVFPEYKIYQNDYIALEKFRSTYTSEAAPAFVTGVKQIVLERADKGPPVIDRCTSCHVALDVPYFSPTKIARDVNGQIERDLEGKPLQIPNEDYIWKKLDEEIAKLLDPQVIQQLKQQGNNTAIRDREKQAEAYKALKTAQVGDNLYDVTKVLKMHPLMGRETRPFEYHPLQQYGCTSCHNGNGRGLTTEKAHGPVFDEQYETEFEGPRPIFVESDPLNDPPFASQFNFKPGPSIIFQTTPIFVGPLMQSKCLNCHQESLTALQGAAGAAARVAEMRKNMSQSIQNSLVEEKEALTALVELHLAIKKNGLEKTIAQLQQRAENYRLTSKERSQAASQAEYIEKLGKNEKSVEEALKNNLERMLGSSTLTSQLILSTEKHPGHLKETIDQFLEKETNANEKGPIFVKEELLNADKAIVRHVEDTQESFAKTISDQKVIHAMISDIDLLTKNYHRGEQLYISQACYACHRISGFARGGVGPDLTAEGLNYPWFIKRKMVWPQGDLPTSTMPNYKLDHDELQDLMTFLLGQTGSNPAVSETDYKINVREWEAGKKLPWEKPVSPDKIRDLRYSMTVFATEGCSACHRLKGFESNVGYTIEKQAKPTWEERYKESQWFTQLFPETINGSEIVKVIDKHRDEIDRRLADDVRKNSLIEEIDKSIPGQVESLYTNFKYAARAKNYLFMELASAEKDPAKKKELQKQLEAYKQRVHKVLMVFIQEYGFGRIVGPKPNWSGVYRSDEWLMEHFRNPTSHVPHSIMPVFPFDDSKFYALTYMLDVLGKQNRDAVRALWEHRGFNPEQAFHIHCAQCHGDYLQGNGPVAEWIYPIPKNLRNGDFLRNYTEERVIQAIQYGVKGTPMPPWGEVGGHKAIMDNIPVLNPSEVRQLADWIFSSLPGGTVIRGAQDVPKWNYSVEDVIRELHEEGNTLEGKTHE